MLGFNIDMLILGLFLVINLVIGLFSSRRVVSLQDYAIGRKDFSTATLTATIVVSWIAGMYVFEILEHTYTDGLYFIIVISGASICLWLVGLLAVRMLEFLKNISVADAMGSMYGKPVQVVTAISGVLSVLALVAMEFHVVSRIISLIVGATSNWTPVIAAGVVILYSVCGGIRAVTFTDVVQFFTFGMFIPILALVIWNQLKDPHQVITLLTTHPNFRWSQVISWHPKLVATLAMFLWFMLPAMDPVVFQRISMARDVIQVKRSFSYAALISLVVCLFLAWIAILLLASDPHLEPSKLFDYVINMYTSPGLRGFMGIGVLALAMSTADSYLSASAVLLTHDIVKPLGIKLKQEKEVLVARMFCLFSGIIALFIALQFKGLLELLQFANSLYMPIVTIPLLMAILGFRSSSLAVLIGMGMGIGTVIGGRFIFKEGDSSIILGMAANLIGLLGSHYVLKQPGGWVGVWKPQSLLEIWAKYQEAWKKFKKSIQAFNLSQYLGKNLPQENYLLSIFGIYVIAATYASFYTVPEVVQQQYAGFYHIIGQSVLFISTGFLTYPLWPSIFRNERFIAWVWPLSTFYVLFGVGTWLVVLSNFHTFQTMIFLLNVVMAFLLFDWPLVASMLVLGVLSATYILKFYMHLPILLGDFGTIQFKIVYGLLLLSSFVALFNHQQEHKQLMSHNAYLQFLQSKRTENLQRALQDRQQFIHTLTIDCIQGLERLYQGGKSLLEKMGQIHTAAQCKEILKEVKVLLAQQQQAATYLTKSIYPFKEYMRLDIQRIDLSSFLATTLKRWSLVGDQPKPEVIMQPLTQDKAIQADPNQIEKLLISGLQFLQAQNHYNKPIKVLVQEITLMYEVYFIPHYTKSMPGIKLIFTTVEDPVITTISQLEPVHIFLPRHIEEMSKEESEQIIEAHYGIASWEATGEDITQTYILPMELRKVRPELIDEPQMK